MAPTVGLALIVRDEEETLPGLLASIEGAFDQVVLVDTGSRDRTKDVFGAWAERQQLPLGYEIDRFEWRDDFSAARNYADSLLTTRWACWADADDTIVGARSLRRIVADVEPIGAEMLAFDYSYRGGTIKRERLARSGTATWVGRVHEMRHSRRPHAVEVMPEVCRWNHRDGEHPENSRRDLRIARAWAAAEPDNPLALARAASAELIAGTRRRAVGYLRRYQALECVRQVSSQLPPDALSSARAAISGLASPDEASDIALLRDALMLPPQFWAAIQSAQTGLDERQTTALRPMHLEVA